MADEITAFMGDYVSKIRPLFKKIQHSWWNSYSTGKEEYYSEYEALVKEHNKIHNSKEDFEKVRRLLKKNIKEPLIKRQLQIIYNEYLFAQGDIELLNKIAAKQTTIEK